MAFNGQREGLEFLKEKLIKHKENALQKELSYAYSRGDFTNAMKITNQLMEIKNKRLDNINNKVNNKLMGIEKQLSQVINSVEGIDHYLGIKVTPRQQQIIQTAVHEPINQQQDMEAERLLGEIMQQGNRRM